MTTHSANDFPMPITIATQPQSANLSIFDTNFNTISGYLANVSNTIITPGGNTGQVQINYNGQLSAFGGYGQTYTTQTFDSNGMLTIDGTTAYQQRIDYTPYITVFAPYVESTNYGVIAGPAHSLVGFDDGYNIPHAAYYSVSDQNTATQQWDFGILGNGDVSFTLRDRTHGNTWVFGSNGSIVFPNQTLQNTAWTGVGPGVSSPGGAYQSIQYNDFGNFGGSGSFTTDGAGNVSISNSLTVTGNIISNTILALNNDNINIISDNATWTFDGANTSTFGVPTLTFPGNYGAIGDLDQQGGIELYSSNTISYAALNSGYDQYMWVDIHNAYIGTNYFANGSYYSNVPRIWTFDKNGNLTLPTYGSTITGGLDHITIMADTGSGSWTFYSNNVLVTPDSISIAGHYMLPNVDGTINQVLTTDGAGNVTWGYGGGGNTSTLTNNGYSVSLDTSGNLIPESNNAQNLGSPANLWKNIYSASGQYGNVLISGALSSLSNTGLTLSTNVAPTTIVLTGADHTPVNGTYTKPNAALIWYNTSSSPSGQQYITYTNVYGWQAFSLDINSTPIYVNLGSLTNPLEQWNQGYGSSPPTGAYTFPSNSWVFDNTGNLTLPGDLLPSSNNSQNIGSPSQQWESLHVSNGSIYINGARISSANGNIQFANDVNLSQNTLTVNTIAFTDGAFSNGTNLVILGNPAANAKSGSLQFANGGYVYFGNTSGYGYTFGENYWSIECWFYPTDLNNVYLFGSGGNHSLYVQFPNSSSVEIGAVNYQQTAGFNLAYPDSGGTVAPLALNQWHYFRLVAGFSGGNFYHLNIDGHIYSSPSFVGNFNYNTDADGIGHGYTSYSGDTFINEGFFTGLISQFKIAANTGPGAWWNSFFTSSTPPNTPLTVDDSTVILLSSTNYSNVFVDHSYSNMNVYVYSGGGGSVTQNNSGPNLIVGNAYYYEWQFNGDGQFITPQGGMISFGQQTGWMDVIAPQNYGVQLASHSFDSLVSVSDHTITSATPGNINFLSLIHI